MKSQKSYFRTAGSGVQDHQHGGLKGRGRVNQRAKIRKKLLIFHGDKTTNYP